MFMKTIKARLTILASALAAGALSLPLHATTVSPVTNGNWYQFDVDDLIANSGGTEWIDGITGEPGYNGDGSALTFSFTLGNAAILKITDAGFAGDEFKLTINGNDYFSSAVADFYPDSIGTDFDAALNSGSYSHFSILLNPGSYVVTGELAQSALDDFGFGGHRSPW